MILNTYTLQMKVFPVDENCTELETDKLEYIENPKELLDRRVDICLKIEEVNFKEDNYKDVYCEYNLLTSEGINTFKTEKVTKLASIKFLKLL